MERLVVTFCGHRDVPEKERIKTLLKNELYKLINNNRDKFFSFYLGGYGDFDNLAREAVDEVKNAINFKCERVFVSPYINFDRKFLSKFYDDFIYPPLEKVPLNLAIVRRNMWMCDNADIMFAHVIWRGRGSGKTLDYAERRLRLHGSPEIIYIN